VLIPSGIVREVNAVQLLKTVLSKILRSPVGSRMDVREVFPLNVLGFNTVTCVADKSIDVKEVHPATIPAGRNVVPLGKCMDLRDVQVLN